MAKTYSRKSKVTRNGATIEKSVKGTKMTGREYRLERERLKSGLDASAQKERMKQEGKTSRAKAYSAAVGATGVSSAANMRKESGSPNQAEAFTGMAGGGVGSTEAGNVQNEGSNGANNNGVIFSR